MMYNEWFPFVDYGIDLEELNERAKGMMQQHWKKGMKEVNTVDTLEKVKL
jgi:hypothetical protein